MYAMQHYEQLLNNSSLDKAELKHQDPVHREAEPFGAVLDRSS
jgi:hypothetical protein